MNTIGQIIAILLVVLQTYQGFRMVAHPSHSLCASRYKPAFANPVTADGSKYRSDVSEQDAFLWFDEAIVDARGGSGGAGSNTFKLGKSRQQLGKYV